MKRLYCIAAFFLMLFVSCSPYERIKGVHLQLQDPVIRQRYGGEMGALADELKQAGVTLVISPVLVDGIAFYPSDLLPQRWEQGTQLLAFRHELRRRNIRFAARVPVFKDDYTQRSQPVLQAVNDYGAGIREWVCPANPEYRNYKLQIIGEVMLVLQPDVLYLDNCYFPAEHVQNNGTLSNTSVRSSCFCNACMADFSRYAGLELPANATGTDILGHYRKEWTLWRSGMITAYAEAIGKQVHATNPACRILLERRPWPETFLSGGLQRIYGLDVKTLHPFVDAYALTAFPELSPENDSLLTAVVRESAALGKRAIPSLQVRNYLRNGEEHFRNDLKAWRQYFIIYDWGMLLNNRRLLNIFISES
ncbi:MAG: hypothetical protein WC372_00220 [Candidatus Neomarinimicrobiota bacterium]|jgi:hypothetical protein